MSRCRTRTDDRNLRIAGALVVLLVAALVALLATSGQAHAGTRCDTARVSPREVANAASTALTVAQALDDANAPVAIVSRVGTDLSEQGLRYSHAGFAVRDHVDGRWTIVHLLNDCGSDRAALHAEGLVNFFADDLVVQDARIVWLEPTMAQRLAQRLNALPRDPLLSHRYNLIARPGSAADQNSTAWIMEELGAAIPPTLEVHDRRQAWRLAQANGFEPDTIHIPYTQRILGGLFGTNIAFTDHSVATRLRGDYPVTTVRSILDWLRRAGYLQAEREWRSGRWAAVPGPA